MSRHADELAPFILVVDSREQLPYSFDGIARSIRAALPAGDYSIVGHEGSFVVERKSLQDAYSTFSSGRERFVRELEKLRTYELAVILIEGSLDDVLDNRPGHVRHVQPATVVNSLLSWQVEYGVTPIFGSIDRDRSRALVFRLAERFWRRKHPGPEASAPDQSREPQEPRDPRDSGRPSRA